MDGFRMWTHVRLNVDVTALPLLRSGKATPSEIHTHTYTHTNKHTHTQDTGGREPVLDAENTAA